MRNKGVEERNRRDQEEQEKLLDPAEVLEAKMQHYRNMGRILCFFFPTKAVMNDVLLASD